MKNKNIPPSIQKIHLAESWTEHDPQIKKDEKLTINFLTEEESLAEMSQDRIIDLTKRKDLDSYVWRISPEVIDPASNTTVSDIVDLSREIFIRRFGLKNKFNFLLSPYKLNLKQNLDEKFLWYQAEYISNSRNLMYLGVPTFISILAGQVALKQKYKSKDPIKLLRFVHRNEGRTDIEENDYTYGILIHSYQRNNLYDKGWLLFLDFCRDAASFSGGMHREAEELIQFYVKKGILQEETIHIKQDELEKYLNQQTVLNRGEIELNDRIKKLEGRDKRLKGFLFELFCCYYASKVYPISTTIDWSGGDGQNDEIDIIIKTGTEIIAVECKLSNGINVENEIEKLRKKVEIVFGDDSTKVKKLFLFWKEPYADQKKEFSEKGIEYAFLSVVAKSKLKMNSEQVIQIFNETTYSMLDDYNIVFGPERTEEE